MLTFGFLTLGLAATVSVALPARKLNTPGPWCDGLGAGAFDLQPNFTLAAWNSTGINTNNTGVPLVLGQAGAIDGAEFKVLSTLESYPFDDYPLIDLSEGRLLPHGHNAPPAGGLTVTNGSEPSFIAGRGIDPKKGTQSYCAVASTDPAGHSTGHPFLAVNGDTDSFSLCMAGSQNNIVFRPAQNNSYDFNSCYPVKVQLIYEF